VTRKKKDPPSSHSEISDRWEFAGWGRSRKIENLGDAKVSQRELGVSTAHQKKLGEWPATAICGNDITSSCLYVSALSILAAGKWAPVALLVVAALLYLFRKIYSEVLSALPLNGGTYTVLLNTTNKKLAAAAAVLTLLSYVATAVISAGEAMHYLHGLIHSLPVMAATVALLGLFAFLNLLGISESSKVALGIFVIHMVTLSVLSITAIYTVLGDPSVLFANWSAPMPEGRGLGRALFLGFAAAMLGISGFESSANYIEEQREGVFPKTLRNMWLAVSIFNPLICLLALGLVPVGEVADHKMSLLAEMGQRSAGSWLATLVSIDAVLVLSGAVLTSFVGVTGLVRRMSLDRCLPQFFLNENAWRQTNHWIIIAFFGLCCSILFATEGHVERLAGVYTLSFLCVMALFAIGNMLLKSSRSRLPTSGRASWPAVLLALGAVGIGIAGNVSPENLEIFATYFGIMAAAVGTMFLRIPILKALLYVSRAIVSRVTRLNRRISSYVIERIELIHSQRVVYFTKGDGIVTLNHAALYVRENEQTDQMVVVHVYDKEASIPPDLGEQLKTVDRLYPELRIDFLAVKGEFGPDLIEKLSSRLDVPKNYMFIGTPGDKFPHRLQEMGGVRMIIG
jgi:amino acid transporter